MGNIKRKHSAAFKAKIVLELIRGDDTMTTICSRYSIHPTQAGQWKHQALRELQTVFSSNKGAELKEKNELVQELYKQIGQLTYELDWLKKKMDVFSK